MNRLLRLRLPLLLLQPLEEHILLRMRLAGDRVKFAYGLFDQVTSVTPCAQHVLGRHFQPDVFSERITLRNHSIVISGVEGIIRRRQGDVGGR